MLVVGLAVKTSQKGAGFGKLLLAIFQTQNLWIWDLFWIENTHLFFAIAYWVCVNFFQVYYQKSMICI